MYLIARHSCKAYSCTWHHPDSAIQRSEEKHNNDDNNDEDTLTVFRSLLAYDNDNNNNNKACEDNDNNNSNKEGDDKSSWINRWIDKPPGEGGHKAKDGRPGWGKPKIMKTTGITDGQYNCYMVSFLVIFTVGFIDSISPRCLPITCVTDISTPWRPLAPTLHSDWPNMASLSKKYVQSYLFFCIHWQWGDERSPSMLLVPHWWLAHLPSGRCGETRSAALVSGATWLWEEWWVTKDVSERELRVRGAL